METEHSKVATPENNDEALALIRQRFADGWKLNGLWFIRPVPPPVVESAKPEGGAS